ncbi:hypothetical protein AALB16_02905 [Lachnospiraceae bacterium 62-35]
MADRKGKENKKEVKIEEFNKNYGCLIENFIKDTDSEYSICREERQYAVFLYNILRYWRDPEKRKLDKRAKGIFTACRIPEDAMVTQVFYEAAFMRDFFERNRRSILSSYHTGRLLTKTFSVSDYEIDKEYSFNYKLMKYVHRKEDENGKTENQEQDWEQEKIQERNLGRNEINTSLSPRERFTIRCMMEAKPDIAVIYERKKHEKKIRELLFLECKYDSSEAYYKSEDSQGGKLKISQSEIQGKIAEFLCEYLNENDKEEEIAVSHSMGSEKENKKSCIVQFVRSNGTDECAQETDQTGDECLQKTEQMEQEKGTILIRDLIRLNNEIFL